LFVVIELEVDQPLLDIRIFRYWAFTHSLLLIAVLMVVMFGVLFYIPQFLQVAQGWGALDAGLTLLPQAMVMGVLMPIAGRLYDRFGPRWPVTIGLLIAATGTYLLHTITIVTTREHLIVLLMIQATGLGLAMMPIFTSGIAVIPLNKTNTASAFNNVARNVAGAFGLSVLTAILTIHQAQQMSGRASLLPANTLTPHLGPPGTPDWLGAYAVYQQTAGQVFVGAIDDLFLIGAVLAGLGALGALFMRNGTAPALAPTAAPAGRAAGNGAASTGGTTGTAAPGSNGAVSVTTGTAAPGSNGAESNGTGSNAGRNGSPHRSPEREVTSPVGDSPPGIP
jgi:MFS family permease